MSGKFMKVLKICIPTLTLVLIASQLLNACAVSSNELLGMYERQQAITIEVAEPISQEQGTEKALDWTELAFLQTYPEFRELFDDTIGVTIQGQNGKNGVVYVDLNNKHTNNSTLRFAFANAKFHNKLWNNTENMKVLTDAISEVYADINDVGTAKYAVLNAYFNIIPDSEPNYFNGNKTLTRGEFLAALFRAGTPVHDISSDLEFQATVDPGNMNSTVDYASQIQDYSYLTLEDQSLNAGTYSGVITRAEAVYTIVKMYYSNELANVTGSESCYSDAKNAGDLALKEGFKVQDKETGVISFKNYWKSYELSTAIAHPDKGLPNDLYRALVVAKNNNLLPGNSSRWDDGLTKTEALKLIVAVYTDLGTLISADRGSSTGQVADNETNTDTNQTQEVMDKLTFTEFHITEEDYVRDENNALEFSYELVEYIKSFPMYSRYDNETIVAIIQSPLFHTIWDIGKDFENIQGQLEESFSSDGTHEMFRTSVLKVFEAEELIGAYDPAGNTGGTIVDGGSNAAPDRPTNSNTENNTDNKEFNGGTEAEENVDNKQEEEQVPQATPKQEDESKPVETPAPTEAPKQEEAKPTPKPTEVPKPTATPKPTETPKQETQTLTVLKPINPEDPSEGFYEDTITSTGTIIVKKGNSYFIPDGLEDYHEPIYIKTKYEKMAWTTKYPGADSGTITIAQNGEDVKYYFVIPGGRIIGSAILDENWIDTGVH